MPSIGKDRWIRDRALSLGFDICGFVALNSGAEAGENSGMFADLARLPEWLDRGFAGEMKYLRDPRRRDPRSTLEGARSLIVVAVNYNTPPIASRAEAAASDGSPRGSISRYAWGDDYHAVILEKLNTLVVGMRAQFAEAFEARAYVDTGPILERAAAKYAGLGWLGKNTCLINPQFGSWLFLGVIVTTLDLAPFPTPNQVPPPDLCGTCTRCLDACPTQAFPEPYVLDARRCISYLTIELRGAIPEELRPHLGNAVIGCDICQDVCPWNRRAPFTPMREFHPREIENGNSLLVPELEWLASLTREDFSSAFRRSAVKRAKWRGLVRNACVALGNSGTTQGSPNHARIIRLLESLANSEDSLIAEHARWALDRLSAPAARPGQQLDSKSRPAAEVAPKTR